MNVLSLFDGISCGQTALKRINIKINNYFASEIDKDAIKVTQYHYPNTIELGNVENIRGKNLPKTKRYQVIGNGWTINVIAYILNGIL